jgi:hypothetical protein
LAVEDDNGAIILFLKERGEKKGGTLLFPLVHQSTVDIAFRQEYLINA